MRLEHEPEPASLMVTSRSTQQRWRRQQGNGYQDTQFVSARERGQTRFAGDKRKPSPFDPTHADAGQGSEFQRPQSDGTAGCLGELRLRWKPKLSSGL